MQYSSWMILPVSGPTADSIHQGWWTTPSQEPILYPNGSLETDSSLAKIYKGLEWEDKPHLKNTSHQSWKYRTKRCITVTMQPMPFWGWSTKKKTLTSQSKSLYHDATLNGYYQEGAILGLMHWKDSGNPATSANLIGRKNKIVLWSKVHTHQCSCTCNPESSSETEFMRLSHAETPDFILQLGYRSSMTKGNQ